MFLLTIKGDPVVILTRDYKVYDDNSQMFGYFCTHYEFNKFDYTGYHRFIDHVSVVVAV